MNRITRRVATAALAIPVVASLAIAIPAAASQHRQFAHLASASAATCLAAPPSGGQVRDVACAWTRHSQMWRLQNGPRVVTIGGLCLTAVSRSLITAARCAGPGHGQQWHRTGGFGGLESARWPLLCLTGARHWRHGPVRLTPCDSAGEPQTWVWTQRP